jgi:hypothetical protein
MILNLSEPGGILRRGTSARQVALRIAEFRIGIFVL